MMMKPKAGAAAASKSHTQKPSALTQQTPSQSMSNTATLIL